LLSDLGVLRLPALSFGLESFDASRELRQDFVELGQAAVLKGDQGF